MRCFGPFFHDWGKWVHWGRYKYRGTNQIFSNVYQRECKKCGKRQQEEL